MMQPVHLPAHTSGYRRLEGEAEARVVHSRSCRQFTRKVPCFPPERLGRLQALWWVCRTMVGLVDMDGPKSHCDGALCGVCSRGRAYMKLGWRPCGQHGRQGRSGRYSVTGGSAQGPTSSAQEAALTRDHARAFTAHCFVPYSAGRQPARPRPCTWPVLALCSPLPAGIRNPTEPPRAQHRPSPVPSPYSLTIASRMPAGEGERAENKGSGVGVSIELVPLAS